MSCSYNSPELERPTASLVIRRFLLDMIDDEDGHRTLFFFQFEPELLIQRIEG
jgi:hypothetical protein